MAARVNELGDVVAAAVGYLARRGIEDARVASEWLVAERCSIPRLELPLHRAQVLSDALLDRLRDDVLRLGRGEPLQYLLGSASFRGHVFRCDPRALIPRPETEELVQLCLDEPSLRELAAPRFADIGTGTGCIAASLVLECPDAHCVAVDCSADALDLARKNAAALGVSGRIEFRIGIGAAGLPAGSCDAIVSNPPYIPSGAIPGLPRNVRDHEPRLALDGGADGLDVARDIARDAVIALRKGGWLFFELGEDQPRPMLDILEDLGFDARSAHRDLSGVERFVKARFPG
ncbi:MAG: peptide chain release factor N(5)-glutamine methyltransferase [Kiritimatiellia bacterium]|jgi:release factor glutamine methyltransferase